MSQEEFEKMVSCVNTPDFSKIVDYLEEHRGKIDVNRVGRVPYTILERASGHGRLDVVQYLLRYGADIDLQSRMIIDGTLVFLSLPPILYAVDFPDVLEFFVDNGVVYDYQLTNEDQHYNILSAILLKFARSKSSIDEALMLRLIDKCSSCSGSSKQEILQIVLRFHFVLFNDIFLMALAEKSIKFDKDFRFGNMHMLPCNKAYPVWWSNSGIISYILQKCSNAILDHPVIENVGRARHATTLRDLLTTSGLLKDESIVRRLSAANVIHFHKSLRRLDDEYDELEAAYLRIRTLCFKMYENFVRIKYHPSSKLVTQLVKEWADELIEPY